MQSEILAPLSSALAKRSSWCHGTAAAPTRCFTLFYGKEENARRLNVLEATDDQLQDLERACDVATFGVNQEDVLDENYRKAGKLNLEDFATCLDVDASDVGLVDAVRQGIVEDSVGDDKRRVKAELYKLNVYGPGSFFKAHKDTPRAENMFGSLVLVFPTVHSGGALTLRSDGEELVVDSGETFSADRKAEFVYAAFYSEIEHEVSPVTAGYRITLTYNLYFAQDSPPQAPRVGLTKSVPCREAQMVSAFRRLLEDPTFLPDGGRIGFGLRHQYPVPADGRILRLLANLKGNDALLDRVCSTLKLSVSPKAIYEADGCLIMLGKVVDIRRYGMLEASLFDFLLGNRGSLSSPGDLIQLSPQILEEQEQKQEKKAKKRNTRKAQKAREESPPPLEVDEAVLWATPLNTMNRVEKAYTAYGNEASLEFAYADLCIVVKIGRFGKRETRPSDETLKRTLDRLDERPAKKQKR